MHNNISRSSRTSIHQFYPSHFLSFSQVTISFIALLLALLLTSFTLNGEENVSTPKTRQNSSELGAQLGKQMLQLSLSMGALTAVLIGSGWIFRRLGDRRMRSLNQNYGIKVVERRQLNPKNALILVEVDGVRWLLSESAGGLRGVGQLPITQEVPTKCDSR